VASLKELPSVKVLNEIYRYDAMHGHLYLKQCRYSYLVMRRAERESRSGYLILAPTINGTRLSLLAHRVIWKMVTGFDPSSEVDHLDQDKSNNRFFNLRVVSRRQKAINRRAASPFGPGIRMTGAGHFKAVTAFEKRRIYVGTFKTEKDAREAVEKAQISAMKEQIK